MTTPPDGMALAIAAPPSDLPTTVIPHSQSNDTAITGTIVPVILGRERLLGVPEICEITGFCNVTAARLIKESGCGIKVHSRLFVLESSFFNYPHRLEVTEPCSL